MITLLIVLSLILLVGWVVGIAVKDGVIPMPVAAAVTVLSVLGIGWIYANQVYG